MTSLFSLYDCPCRYCWSWFRNCRDCVVKAEADIDHARQEFITACEQRQQASIEMERIVNAKLGLIDRTVHEGQEHLAKMLEKVSENSRGMSVPLQIPQTIYASYPEIARQVEAIIQAYEEQIRKANAAMIVLSGKLRHQIVDYNKLVGHMPSRHRRQLGIKAKDPEEEVRFATNQTALTKPPATILTDQTAKGILSFDNQLSSPQQRLSNDNTEEHPS